MTQNDQIELLKLIKKNLVSIYSHVKYKYNDLDFTADMEVVFSQMDIVIREFNEAGLQPATQIAVQYMKNQPNASTDKVCDFVTQVMKTIKSV